MRSNRRGPDATPLTSHEVARLLGVSPSAVLSWVERGWLQAHRTPGGHRRFARSALLSFLRSRKMPVPQELIVVARLLVIDDDPTFLRAIERTLPTQLPGLTVQTAESAVDGLLKVGTF